MAIRKKKATTKKRVSKKKVVKKKADKGSEYFNKLVSTPRGVLSYPTLAEPRQTTDGKEQYSTDLFVSKEEMLGEKGQRFLGVIDEALEFYGLDQDECEYFPIVDMDEQDDCPDFAKGTYRIRAKNKLAVPSVIDRKKVELTADEVAQIKGGDIGKISVSPYSYTFNGTPGFGLGLEVVMFIEEGEPLGGGSVARLAAIDDMEVEELEDEEIEEEVEADEDDTEFDD